MKYVFVYIFVLFFAGNWKLFSQAPYYWQGIERELRYKPEGNDFVIINGKNKFNRALYGTNTAFRVETSDVPEFGLFMPNMGGNLKLGIIRQSGSLWLNDARYIKSVYRAGSRIYEIKDAFIGNGKLEITVLAMSDADGVILRVKGENLPSDLKMLCMFGGATNKRFSRNGDLGVDPPDAFALTSDGCLNNSYRITDNTFQLDYGQETKSPHTSTGIFPKNATLKTGSSDAIDSPSEVWQSVAENNKTVLLAEFSMTSSENYYVVIKSEDGNELSDGDLEKHFYAAERRREEISSTVKIKTPDPYITPLGGVLSIAADGIWDDCWLHGAVGWRIPLNGWRAAYTGDAIGWHQRSREHFDGYAASQIIHIEPVIPQPAQDSSLNLARALKKWGTPMYSNGYICRKPYDTTQMNHYDMNLCYIDELVWHFNWTGDMEYVKQMWPVLERHLAWEKRNFDPDNDGLYDAYACIWASDALYYNSGGVTYSSSYNFRANKMAAEIATKIGKNPAPYKREADKILQAINNQLWLDSKGWWAEYRDFSGNKMVHPNAAVWSIYCAADSDIQSPFQAYQATRYIDTHIPKIPVLAKGLKDENYYTISTTDWLPYSWSVNNVAFAEVAHTALAYWQAGRNNEAFKLFKSAILDGMYMGSSPGNIGQISFYDAARGECYRDFGDPVGVYSRALVQGLFGILPDLMNNRLLLQPGFPNEWDSASISTSDIDFDFKRENRGDQYTVKSYFAKPADVELLVKSRKDAIENITVNGSKHDWTIEESVGYPQVKIRCSYSDSLEIDIIWKGEDLQNPVYKQHGVSGEEWELKSSNKIVKIYDPQGVLSNSKTENNTLRCMLAGEPGYRTLFVQLRQNQMTWWEPVNIEIKEPFGITGNPEREDLQLVITNNTCRTVKAVLKVNPQIVNYSQKLVLKPNTMTDTLEIPSEYAVFGTNIIRIEEKGKPVFEKTFINWKIDNSKEDYKTIDMDPYWNASVTDIFKQDYLSPRSPYTTLQIPKQGIGEWCHPILTAEIDDSGFRKNMRNGIFFTPFNIPFRTEADTKKNNIAFVSLWDNYPGKIDIPLSGKASHIYLLMAGSANHMQYHITNGIVMVEYSDGSQEILELINPETWLPIEQDLYIDGYAFRTKVPRPYRVAFKSGVVSRNLGKELNINPNEVYGRSIDGGAGLILDIPLDPNKELKSLSVKAVANDVVIGLMSATLLR